MDGGPCRISAGRNATAVVEELAHDAFTCALCLTMLLTVVLVGSAFRAIMVLSKSTVEAEDTDC